MLEFKYGVSIYMFYTILLTFRFKGHFRTYKSFTVINKDYRLTRGLGFTGMTYLLQTFSIAYFNVQRYPEFWFASIIAFIYGYLHAPVRSKNGK